MKTTWHAILSMIVVFAALCAIALAASGKAKPLPKTSKTLQNLQTAYNGESNAHAKYLLLTQKADEEGYGEVASLFRAAARAEQIHLTNHAAVIREMGAEPQAKIDTPEVKSTRENLADSANKGEAYERDTMYPKFIKQAKLENVPDAVQSFEYARMAEAQHFKLFTEALNNLDNMRLARVARTTSAPSAALPRRRKPRRSVPAVPYTKKGTRRSTSFNPFPHEDSYPVNQPVITCFEALVPLYAAAEQGDPMLSYNRIMAFVPTRVRGCSGCAC